MGDGSVPAFGEKVVDVLHEDEVTAGRRKVAEQRAVSGRTQQQAAVGGAGGTTVGVESQGVGRGSLL